MPTRTVFCDLGARPGWHKEAAFATPAMRNAHSDTNHAHHRHTTRPPPTHLGVQSCSPEGGEGVFLAAFANPLRLHFGPVGEHLGARWRAPGSPPGPVGEHLGPVGEPVGEHLGSRWRAPGSSPGPVGEHLGPVGEPVGEHLGARWRAPGSPQGSAVQVWRKFRASFVHVLTQTRHRCFTRFETHGARRAGASLAQVLAQVSNFGKTRAQEFTNEDLTFKVRGRDTKPL
jgi:hypothetical protein